MRPRELFARCSGVIARMSLRHEPATGSPMSHVASTPATALVLAAVSLIAACGGSGGSDAGGPTVPSGCHITAVVVSPDSLSLAVGESRDLVAAYAGTGCSDKLAVTWSTGNASVLSLQPGTPGSGVATVTGVAAAAQPVTVTASLGGVSGSARVTVLGRPTIKLTPQSLTFTAVSHGQAPLPQTVALTNAGGGVLAHLAPDATVYGPGASNWLFIDRNPSLATVAPYDLIIQPTNTAFPPGTYTATIPVVSSDATNSPQNITVTLTLLSSSAAPVISNLSVTLTGVNGCTHADGSLGNAFSFAFSFTDATGNVTLPGATIREFFTFRPTGLTGSATVSATTFTGTGSSGTITTGQCLTFANPGAQADTSVTLMISLVNAASQESNALTATISRPPGGASVGPGRVPPVRRPKVGIP